VRGFSGGKISIQEAFKNKFGYNELLGAEIQKERDRGLNLDIKHPQGFENRQGDLFT